MRRQVLLIGALLAAFMMVAASPATANFGNGPDSAGIVERFEEPGFALFFDDGLIVAANVNSIADLCSGIPAGAGNVQEVTLPSGIVMSLLHDDDVPILVFPDDNPGVICSDPDNWPLIATGVGNVRGTDNDVDVSLTRTNVFGNRVNGSVVDADGQEWSLQAVFRAQIKKSGDFNLLREDINLVPRG